MKYTQTLFEVLPDYISKKILNKKNRYKQWKYGYDKESDVVVISKTGEIGDVYSIQNLKIALPKISDPYEFKKDTWDRIDYPKELEKIKSVFEWNQMPEYFKEKYYDYIDEEFKRRDEGFSFVNKGIPTYITGSHYMYLQWSKIDVGAAEFRESNRLFFIFWEACKADQRCYGMCYLKNRRSGFSTKLQYQAMHGLGYCPNLGPTLKKCSQIKLYPYLLTTRSFSSQYRMEWTDQKQSWHTEYQRRNLREENWIKAKGRRSSRVSTQQSTGRTQATTRTTGRN
jgi:hypothetical protein